MSDDEVLLGVIAFAGTLLSFYYWMRSIFATPLFAARQRGRTFQLKKVMPIGFLGFHMPIEENVISFFPMLHTLCGLTCQSRARR